MKKGFTLSESLISIAIIGVISAILIPILNNVTPDQDRVLYKKAMYTMQNAVATAINDNTIPSSNTSAYWAGDEVTATDFCTNISNTMNVVGSVNCSITGDASNPNFVATNGSKWWGLGNHKFTTSGANQTADVYVDVNGNGGDNTVGVDQLRIRVAHDGRITTDPTWTTENDYLSDAIKFQK